MKCILLQYFNKSILFFKFGRHQIREYFSRTRNLMYLPIIVEVVFTHNGIHLCMIFFFLIIVILLTSSIILRPLLLETITTQSRVVVCRVHGKHFFFNFLIFWAISMTLRGMLRHHVDSTAIVHQNQLMHYNNKHNVYNILKQSETALRNV